MEYGYILLIIGCVCGQFGECGSLSAVANGGATAAVGGVLFRACSGLGTGGWAGWRTMENLVLAAAAHWLDARRMVAEPDAAGAHGG